jgi:predicted aspartyl protease
MLILGAFDDAGNATVKIRVSGDLGTNDYTAIVDTGFSGFVAMPLVEMVPLGLSTQPTAATVILGNGEVIYNLVSAGTVTLGGQAETGSILLDDTTNDVLIGMAFLRTFRLALIVTDTAIVLHDRAETLEAVARFMQTAPVGLPNTSPSSTSLTPGAENE